MQEQNPQESSDVGASLEAYCAPREGNPPLRFTGKIIGTAVDENPNANDSYHRVTIFTTARKKFVVVQVFDWSWRERPRRDAAAFAEAKDVVDWLRSEEDGKLSEVAQRALGEAAAVDDRLAAAFGEDVD
jgi:hypothetical protein